MFTEWFVRSDRCEMISLGVISCFLMVIGVLASLLFVFFLARAIVFALDDALLQEDFFPIHRCVVCGYA